MPPRVQQKVKPIKPKSRTERIAHWTKEQEQAGRRLPRTMATELKHKYTHQTGSKRKDDATLGVAGEDIAPRAESLKGTSLHAKIGTARDKSNHVSTSSEETAQADDQALHFKAINMESTGYENQEEASELTCQNSKVEKSETSHKRPIEQIPKEDLPRDKGDTTSEDSEPDKTLKHLQTLFNKHKNPLYTKTSAMSMQEKMNATGGHPEGIQTIATLRSTGNSTGSTTPSANQNPFNIFNGGATSQMPASPFNPFATCGPTSNTGQTNLFESQQAPTNQKTPSNSSGPTNQSESMPVASLIAGREFNPMLFGMPQYKNFGVNPGVPNFGYGWNRAFPYTPYPITGYPPNNMMQYPIPRNAFGFGGMFNTPFPSNETPSMPNTNNNYRGSGNNGNGGSGSNNNGHNGNSCNGGNNNNGGNLNKGNASNGPSVFQFPDTSLQHLKYEGYTNPSEHLALFLNNVEQRGIQNEIAIKQLFFSNLHGIALQWPSKKSSKPQEKRCITTMNKPNNPRYKGKSEEGNKNVNYQATDEDNIPLIRCPRCITWGHDAKNFPHKDFKGAVCMQCGLDDHKTKDCLRNGKTSNLFSRTPDIY
eukprot:Gb_41261 [translate_table: standard]